MNQLLRLEPTRAGFSLRVVLAATAVLGLLGPVPGSSWAAAQGELNVRSLEVGDRTRSYLLYTPAVDDSRSSPRPLVLAFHGGGGTAKFAAREIGRSLHRIADSEGFYVAYPDAVNKMWDFGAGKVSEALEVRIDDRAFFRTLLDELTITLPIDKRRVFATGISRGGQASYFLACNFPNRIRAIAAVAMSLPRFMLESCEGMPAGVGLAVLNGTRDPLVPYDGGQISLGRKRRGEVLSTDETVAFWRSKNGCAAEPTHQTVINPARDRTSVQRTSWEECEHAPVILYRIEGGGHTWPSGRQYLPKFVIGRVTRDIDGATEAWQFFQGFD